MLFNSLSFLLFFPIVCIVYFAIQQVKYRNTFLLIASYYFYACWKAECLLIILFETIVAYFAAIYMEKDKEKKHSKPILIVSLVLTFLFLFIFKYLHFTASVINTCLELMHIRMSIPDFYLLLPVGISFFTFQIVGYVIDVYNRKLQAEHNFITFSLFIAFFPQLVAGPIERARNLLPQFKMLHRFDPTLAYSGLQDMIWGYFMKLCIAERIAPYVNAVYQHHQYHNGTSLLLGTFFFCFQIYCDFCGYSLIAIGVAKFLGYKLMMNFERPYFASSLKLFWRRWHISLSTWFMDYVYIPLGGNRCSKIRHYINLIVTFLLSGIWHGANWTFIFWGILHGFGLCLESKFRQPSSQESKKSIIKTVFSITFTFLLVAFSWIFFRASSIHVAFEIIAKIFTQPGHLYNGDGYPNQFLGIFCIGILMLKELKDELHLNLHFIHNKNLVISAISFSSLICFILLTAVFSSNEFIYFQF